MRKILIAFLCLSAWTSPTHSQWSGNPANPLLIDKLQMHGDPEIICAGGRYIFTWANSSSKRSLTAYDITGFRLWTSNDLLMINDWLDTGNDVSWRNLWTDHADNTILVQLARNRKSGLTYVTVGKNSPEGLNCWSTGQAFHRAGFNAQQFRLAVNDQNDLFLSVISVEKTSKKTDLSIYKILENGTIAWEHTKFYCEDDSVALDPDITLIPDKLGRCYILYETTNQIPYANGAAFIDTQLKINLFDRKGAAVWSKDVVLFYRKYKFFGPAAIMGDDGYLYCLWGGGTMQKVHPDGYTMWDISGIQIVNDYSIRKILMLENSQAGDIRVFYEANDLQRMGVVGQLVSPDGALKWDPSGLRIVDIPYALWSGQFHLGSFKDTTLIVYDDMEAASQQYRTCMVMADRNGKKIWREPKVLYTQNVYNAAVAGVTNGYNRQFLIVWNWWGAGNDKLYAQNIFTDGKMGVKSSITGDTELHQSIIKGYDVSARVIWLEQQPEIVHYSIRSILGQTVAGGMANGHIQLPYLIPGIYAVTVQSGQNYPETRKILVQ